MPWPQPVRYEIAEETRFGARRLNCFTARPGNVDHLLRGSAANDPKAEAIVDGDRRLTYAALDAAVDKVAGNLKLFFLRMVSISLSEMLSLQMVKTSLKNTNNA